MLAKLYSNISICFMKKVRSCEQRKSSRTSSTSATSRSNSTLSSPSRWSTEQTRTTSSRTGKKRSAVRKPHADYKKLQTDFPDFANAARQEICQKNYDEEFENKKTQVLGQLKDLGNSLLGKFGMSLDNFKLEQNASGGYSVQYVNGQQQ